jgi:hypothetical protein
MRFPPFDDEEPPLDYADNLLEVDPLEVRGGAVSDTGCSWAVKHMLLSWRGCVLLDALHC